MKALALALCLLASPVLAQNCTTTTRPVGDNTNACASTAFVLANGGGGGSGITTLTGDVTAGPGSGSQAATVAKIAGVAVGTPTGTGNVVFSISPTLTGAPALAAATATSINGVTIPSGADTVDLLGTAQTFTAAKTFAAVIGKVTTQAGTTYTLDPADCGTTVRFTNGSAVTVTIPATLTVGCNIAIKQVGAGKVSVNGTAVSAATLTSAHSYTATFGTASIIGITMDASSAATLTGDGS